VDPRGASRPPLSRLHPTVNVLCFSAVLASVLVLDPIRWRQASLAAGLTAVWVVTSGLGWRRTVKLGALGFSLFAPVFLLAPWSAIKERCYLLNRSVN